MNQFQISDGHGFVSDRSESKDAPPYAFQTVTTLDIFNTLQQKIFYWLFFKNQTKTKQKTQTNKKQQQQRGFISILLKRFASALVFVVANSKA